jgi:hypothetical protein
MFIPYAHRRTPTSNWRTQRNHTEQRNLCKTKKIKKETRAAKKKARKKRTYSKTPGAARKANDMRQAAGKSGKYICKFLVKARMYAIE